MQHQSGLKDEEIFHHVENQNTPPIEKYVEKCLTKNGELYKDWSSNTKYHYSNAGITLLGYLIEEVSGLSFVEFIQNRIFDPLQIKNANWLIEKIDVNLLANNYNFYCEPYGHYQVEEYPACQLRISIEDLNKILIIFTSNDERVTILKLTENLKKV